MEKVLGHLKGLWLAIVDLFRRKRLLSSDAQWRTWTEDITRIKKETVYVFENRYVFRRLQEIIRDNPKLKAEAGFFYEWLLGMYGRDMVLAVGRELDKHTEVINLIQLMYQIIQRPDVVGWERYCRMHNIKPGDRTAWPPDRDAVQYEFSRRFFSENIGRGDQLDPAFVKKDRNWLEKRCRKVMKYRHKIVAHRSPMTLTLTVKDLDEALDAIEKMLQKYYGLFTGHALIGAEPTVGIPWEIIFRYPWSPPKGD